MKLPTQDEIDRAQAWEIERYADPTRQRNDHEPADSMRRLLQGDDHPDHD